MNNKKRKILFLFNCTVALVFFSQIALAKKSSQPPRIDGVSSNNEGVTAIEREDFDLAEKHFLKGLAVDPQNPILRMNLGRTYELQKRFDRAQKEYEAVLRMDGIDDQMKFMAHFNSGNAAAQNKDVDGALKHYQSALTIDPSSQETKNNIEVLFLAGSGQGQGGGQNQQPEPNQEPNPDNEGEGEKKPQEFKSENLTKEDVKKIIEEIKSQEKKIRALEFGDKTKEGPPGKDW